MKIAFRVFLGIIVLVIAIGATGVAIITATDPADIRDFLTAEVSEATGRELQIKGDLKLEVSMIPSLVMNDVTFANADWASSPNLLALKRLEAGLELLPLLQGDIRLTQIVMIDPIIKLETNDKGEGSWVFGNQKTSEDAVPQNSTNDPATLPSLNRLLIQKGQFEFKDGQTGETFALSLGELEIKPDGLGGSTLINMSGGYNAIPFEVTGKTSSLYHLADDPNSFLINLTAKAFSANVALKGKIDRPLSEQNIDIATLIKSDDIDQTLKMASELAPVLSTLKLPELGAFEASTRVTGSAKSISLNDLKYELGPNGSVSVKGSGKISGLPENPVFATVLSASGNDLDKFSEISGLKLPKAVPFELSGSLSNPAGGYVVDNFKLKLGGGDNGSLAVSGDTKITGLPANLNYAVNFSATGNDLSMFSELAGLQLPTAPPYEVSGFLSNPKGNYVVDNFKLKLGGSDIEGKIVASLKATVPSLQASLRSNRFDVADVLASLPKSDEKAKPAPKASKDDGRIFSDDPIPFEGMKAANVTLKFNGQQVILGPNPVKDINVNLVLKDGKLTVDQFQAQFSDGKMNGTASLDASVATPKLNIDYQAKGTDVGKLLKDLDLSDLVTGKADAHIKVTSTGSSVRQLMARLNGKTDIVMNEGEVASKYLDLIAADLLKTLVPGGSKETTKINCLVNRLDIKNGLATNTAMLFDTEKMSVVGSGTIDLRTEKLDLSIKPGPKDASLVSLAVPINVTGTLKSPTALPSTASVLKGIAGLALGPVGLLALTVSSGSSDKNPCLTALENKNSSGSAKSPPAQQKSSNPIDDVTKGIGSGLKSLFGGK